MRNLMSFVFDQITDPLELPLSPIREWIILWLIGVIAYRFAFSLVGNMYDDGMISSRGAGSFFHWTLRAIFFVIIWAVVNCVIRIGMWLIANWIFIGTILAWAGLTFLLGLLNGKCGKRNV